MAYIAVSMAMILWFTLAVWLGQRDARARYLRDAIRVLGQALLPMSLAMVAFGQSAIQAAEKFDRLSEALRRQENQ